MNINMLSSELMVDLVPLKRNHAHVDVRFAKAGQLYIVSEHECKNRNELWYTETECNSMAQNIKQDVLQVRARASDSASKGDSSFWIGIAHLVTLQRR